MVAGLVALVGTQVTLGTAAAAEPSAVPAGLEEFYGQQVSWAACERPYQTLECATLSVPLDYRAPDGERIAVTISRKKAADQANRRGVLLLNPGGPGGSGLQWPDILANSPVGKVYDLIGFDPRGVGRSTALLCEVAPALAKVNTRPTDAELPAWAADAQASEAGCERSAGGLRPHVNTPNTARDMDVIRGVLGEKKINYLGYSYGTYLGAVYGSLFPKNLNRSVLDSAVHPEWIWREQFKQQAVATRQNVDLWAEWVGQRNATFRLGKTQAEVLATVEDLAAKLAKKPVSGFDRNSLDLVVGTGARYRQLWDDLGYILLDIKNTTTTAPTDALTAAGLIRDLGIAETRSGVFDTVTCEADWPRDLTGYYSDMKLFREKYPYGFGVMRAAPWTCSFRSFTPPERPVDLKRDGYQTGLVIQADGDTQTQYDGGPAMAQRLRNHLISVADEGTHGFYGFGNACVNRHVERYLIDGVLPPTRVTCAGEARPNVPRGTESVEAAANGAMTQGLAVGDGRGSLTDSVRGYIAANRLMEKVSG
ncbi:alpha/beta fold hydrolase [Streptoalloteichus tenebrarius]|uniref:alpha/beta fold hydrolase n=1 Tax=Streptoalloteichus tenebrarius (strain ATCC 17920 / DSM 40477 / JCM 4838 / CBS 697.72 / NBRC 16177 / NCIMB 11028 / NRRL B-12390 / A12253. 1 / ISP 5477) TaxID=1933 RepID=UPI0020A36957|nr:alpha/beta fold hydrolase [Streptoalloteichus tenebrarius]